MNVPAIISKNDGEFEYSRDKLLRELMDSTDQQQFLSFRNEMINNEQSPAREELIEELILMADAVLNKNKKYLEYVKEIFFQHKKAKNKTLNSSAKNQKEALS